MKRSSLRRIVGVGSIVLMVGLAVTALASVGAAASQEVPANSAQPTISGTPTVGSTLTATQGTWTGSPTSFAFQWVRCPASGGLPDGSDCAFVAGATTQAYVLSTADTGARLRVRVSASNADGSATAASNATGTVAVTQMSQPPTKVSDPTIVGTARVGSTLTATPGQWSNAPTSFAYQWVRCPASGGNPLGSDCATIGGATTQAYQLAAVDLGRRLRVRVTATNADGNAVAASNATAAVQAAVPPPAPTGCPAGAGAIRPEQIAPPARLQIDRQLLVPATVTSSTTSLTVRFHVSACGGRSVQGMLVYVTGVPYNQFTIPAEQATGADGWAELRLNRLRGFPATPRQQLLVMFARARKSGEPLLGGISTRRLVSFPVRLSR